MALHPALNASAPLGCGCADCQIDSEPCPECYQLWWQKMHSNVVLTKSPEKSKIERKLLRNVYENARSFLRFNGIDGVRMAKALRDLDETIEWVKEYDGGTMEEFKLPGIPMPEKEARYLFYCWSTESPEALAGVVRLVEKYHGISFDETPEPSNEPVDNGMYEGETLSQAAMRWSKRVGELERLDELAKFLYVASNFIEQHEATTSPAFYWRLYRLCDAYESGIGHGIQRDGLNNADNSLYGPDVLSLDCNIAYRIGYKQGERRRVAEERKEASATLKPFKTSWGAWFPTNVLGGPMREFAPGKWENAIWPSDAKKQS